MVIRAPMRGVAEVNLSPFPPRHSFDPREFLLEPLLHQSFVPFQRTMQRLLAGDAELSQKPPDRHQAQRDIEFIFDQRRHHLARPQRKCELELQRVLLRHRVVNPLQLLAIEFRRTPKQRLGLQRSPAATSILCQPATDRRTINAENISNHFRAFTILNTAHRTLTHRLQRGVIQSSRIICPHAQRESYSPRHVKKSPLTYVLINNDAVNDERSKLVERVPLFGQVLVAIVCALDAVDYVRKHLLRNVWPDTRTGHERLSRAPQVAGELPRRHRIAAFGFPQLRNLVVKRVLGFAVGAKGGFAAVGGEQVRTLFSVLWHLPNKGKDGGCQRHSVLTLTLHPGRW